ncbi:MAG TPA: 1-deoxy-D-xylulose-5-phosphate synthase, partial [Candidatus Saccharimonadales bacterium]|nr:1-deoxy-D-xylulose-5-phosphate synthase [Candidatus Saccharimonadales bacterium]
MSEAITGDLNYRVSRRRTKSSEEAGGKTEPLLARIDSPADLKGLTLPQLHELCDEVREYVVDVVSRTGGHLAPSLGVVELTVALHYLFDSPRDKMVWDVGHQAYVHKVLTGRRDRLPTIRQFGGISGFLKLSESVHDHFGAGHASTAISAAFGMATRRDLVGEDYHVVAIVGDGAMTGGLAYEALNNAGASGRRLLVILNDNSMSISPNVGAISSYLTGLTTQPVLRKARDEMYHLIEKLPKGNLASDITQRMELSLKNAIVPGSLFNALGFSYFGPIDGHDLDAIIKILGRLKEMEGPVLLHVVTKKGRGLSYAEADPNTYHGVSPFDVPSGKSAPPRADKMPSYTSIFADAAVEIAKKDTRVVAITAAMADGTGLVKYQKEIPDRFFDVGIAEAHAVTFAAGLALHGMRPIAAIYSTFLQRAFDQIIHDVGVQKIPVVFSLDRAGLCGPDGPTHHGVFDLAYLRLVPNFVIAAPSDGVELRNLLHTAVEQTDFPFAIRYPKDSSPVDPSGLPMERIPIGSWTEVRRGERAAILAVGTMVATASQAAAILEKQGLHVGVVNCRFVKPLDDGMLAELAGRHELLVTLEEGTLRGGFGTGVYERLSELGCGMPRLVHLGLPDRFIEHGSRPRLFESLGLSPAQIA